MTYKAKLVLVGLAGLLAGAALTLNLSAIANKDAQTALPVEARTVRYAECLAEARSWAEKLGEPDGKAQDEACERFGELRFFNVG